MKYIFSFILFLLSHITIAQLDPCDLYGKVYITNNIHEAHYHVYLDTLEEETHDLIVYKESNVLYADSSGKWYFIDQKGFANFNIYFVKQANLAHFIISYTDIDDFAGCDKW